MENKEPLIRDIPSIKKNLEDMRNFKYFKASMPILKPLLKILGADTTKLEEALEKFDDLEKEAFELAYIPDRFNDIFASRGWIIYDLMNLDIAKSAIDKAESGDVDGAEQNLVEYYSGDTIRWKLKTMMGIQAFHPRMNLAQKTLIDYEEERYHACVPVILALLDGLVNELHEKRQGFFANGVTLEAWDSIAAHSRGLGVLTAIFQKGRRKTTTEKITVPYRNGIMHGMDLGYDNKVVAVKTWAALFSVREWALKVEHGKLKKLPEEPEPSWKELFAQIKEIEADKERLKNWKPRYVIIGNSIPATGGPQDYENETPEQKLAEFLTFWKAHNYGHMAKCLTKYSYIDQKALPAKVREVYGKRDLVDFEILEIVDDSPATTKISIRIEYIESETKTIKTISFEMMCEDSSGEVAIRGKSESGWTVWKWQIF